jgi:hypothetical protein
MTTFYCLRFETPPTWRARNREAGYIPRQCVPFPPPRTTRRAAMEVFDPSSTRDITVVIHCTPFRVHTRTVRKTRSGQPLLWYAVEYPTWGIADNSSTLWTDMIAGISAGALCYSIRCKSVSRYVAHIESFKVVTPRHFEPKAFVMCVECLKSQSVKYI